MLGLLGAAPYATKRAREQKMKRLTKAAINVPGADQGKYAYPTVPPAPVVLPVRMRLKAVPRLGNEVVSAVEVQRRLIKMCPHYARGYIEHMFT